LTAVAITNAALLKPPSSLLDGRMVTMIETALQNAAGLFRRRHHFSSFG
jgi:hypothetical protein